MSVAIGESCVKCGACEWECPNAAITPGKLRPVVNQLLCTECYGFFGESQCTVVCPAEAIAIASADPVDVLLAKFQSSNPQLKPQDTWIWRRL